MSLCENVTLHPYEPQFLGFYLLREDEISIQVNARTQDESFYDSSECKETSNARDQFGNMYTILENRSKNEIYAVPFDCREWKESLSRFNR